MFLTHLKMFSDVYYVLRTKGLWWFLLYLYGRVNPVEEVHSIPEPVVEKPKYPTLVRCMELLNQLDRNALLLYRPRIGMSLKVQVVHQSISETLSMLHEAIGVVASSNTVPDRILLSRSVVENLKRKSLDDYLVLSSGIPIKPVEVYDALEKLFGQLEQQFSNLSLSDGYSDYYNRKLTHLMGELEEILLCFAEAQEHAQQQRPGGNASV